MHLNVSPQPLIIFAGASNTKWFGQLWLIVVRCWSTVSNVYFAIANKSPTMVQPLVAQNLAQMHSKLEESLYLLFPNPAIPGVDVKIFVVSNYT